MDIKHSSQIYIISKNSFMLKGQMIQDLYFIITVIIVLAFVIIGVSLVFDVFPHATSKSDYEDDEEITHNGY